MTFTISDVKCPKCHAEEEHPNGKHVLIRAHKVHHSDSWWSQCLVCSGGYDKNLEYAQANSDDAKGWFAS